MTIQAGSRYEDSTLATLVVSNRDRQIIVAGPQSPYTFTFQQYQVTGADRPDSLAVDFYEDESKWYAIADANPEILDWTNMPVGQIIRIPAIT